MTEQRDNSTTLRFAIIGGLGFAVDSTLTVVLTYAGAGAMLARIIGATLAIFATYVLNSRFNFRVKLSLSLASKYAVIQGVGILINFMVYALVVNTLGQSPASLVLAIAAGSLVALIWNLKGAASLFRTGKLLIGKDDGAKPRMQK